MRENLEDLTERVRAVTTASAVADRVEDVSLEPDRDDEGDDYLRVVVKVRSLENAADADFEALLEAIERAVGAVDERYPSVRFSDA